MKEITLNIPSSWDEVTIKQFTKVTLAEGNVYEKMITVLSALTDTPEDDIRTLPATWVEQYGVSEKLAFLMKEPVKKMPLDKLTLNGKKYEVQLYPAKWTAAQYLDYCSVMGEENDKKIARIIACFCIPEDKKYGEGYDFDKVVNEIYSFMPITTALGYAGFFQLQLESFAKAIRRYTSRKKNRRLTRRQAGRLTKRGPKADSTPNGTAS